MGPIKRIYVLLLMSLVLNAYDAHALLSVRPTFRIRLHEQLNCYRTATQHPNYAECQEALSQFPLDEIGSHHRFHAGLRQDEYELPVSKISGNCKVEVSFQSSTQTEISSWYQIVSFADKMATECLLKQGAAWGYALTGVSDNIRIELRHNGIVETNSSASWMSTS